MIVKEVRWIEMVRAYAGMVFWIFFFLGCFRYFYPHIHFLIDHWICSGTNGDIGIHGKMSSTEGLL